MSDTATIWRTEGTVVASAGTVRKGTLLRLTARSDSWYEVVIPTTLAARPGERGLIAITDVRRVAGSQSPRFRAFLTTPPVPAGQPSTGPALPKAFRGFVALGGGYQTSLNSFRDTRTLVENAEQTRFDANYVMKKGPTLDISGGGITAQHVLIGAGLTLFSESNASSIAGSSPSPFFFSQPRAFTGTSDALTRQELALNLLAGGAFPIGSRVQLAAFGGPSFFQVKQDLVTGYTLNDPYPHDDATFKNAITASSQKWQTGFNVGGDIAIFFSRQVGIGFSAKYSHATVELPTGDVTTRVKVGGLQTGGGLRVRF